MCKFDHSHHVLLLGRNSSTIRVDVAAGVPNAKTLPLTLTNIGPHRRMFVGPAKVHESEEGL